VTAGPVPDRLLRHPAVLVGVLAGVQFLAVLDSLAVALALPAIGRDLGLSAGGLTWVVNATSVSLAGGLLLAGRLSDPRRPASSGPGSAAWSPGCSAGGGWPG